MKKKVFQVSSEAMFSRIMGVDIGYGDLKGSNNIHQMLMPSVIGAAPLTRYTDEWNNDAGDIVFDEQGTWYIGEKALFHSKNVRYIKDRGRTTLPDYLRFIYTAIGRLHPHNDEQTVAPVSIATGLPVAHMGDSENLRKMLLGQHKVHTKFTNGVYNVENVAVMPQPYGALFYNTLDEYGQLVSDDLSNGKVLVIDIGRFTTNVITVQDMGYLERASDSVDSGVYVIETHVRQFLEREYHWTDVRPDDIRQIVESEDHSMFIDGEKIGLLDAVHAGQADLAGHVLGLVTELVGEAHNIRAMLITGGGGICMEDWIKERYPRAYLTAEPVMANAIGFSRYGRRRWLQA